MSLRDLVGLAVRNLRRRRLRTVLTVVPNAIGAAAIVLVVAVTLAISSSIENHFRETGLLERIDVQRWSGNQALDDQLVADLAVLDAVVSVARTVNAWGFEALVVEDREVRRLSWVGQEINGTIRNRVVHGRDLDPADTGPLVLIPLDVASALSGGDPVSLVGRTVMARTSEFFFGGPFPWQADCDATTGRCAPQLVPLTVVGVTLDAWSVVAPLDFLQPSAAGQGADYSSVSLRVRSEDQLPAVAAALGTTLGIEDARDPLSTADFRYSIRRDELVELRQSYRTLGAVLGSIGLIALLVSALGVVNTMLMATLERTREIGVMRAIGATRRDVQRVFTVEAGLIGVVGGAAGLALATGVLSIIAVAVGSDQDPTSPFNDFTVLLTRGLLPAALIILVTMAIGVLAGALPARRAARMDPVVALRSE